MVSGRGDGRRVWRGLLLLARFRVAGLAEFAGTSQAFLNSLTPLLGLALAATLLRAVDGAGLDAASDFLSVIIAVLTPPVVIHFFARRWGRETAWLATATAFTWAHWLVLASLAISLMVVGGGLNAAGVPLEQAAMASEFTWAAYGLALHWFILRRGLGLKRWQCAVAVGVVEIGASVLIAGPILLFGQADGGG